MQQMVGRVGYDVMPKGAGINVSGLLNSSRTTETVLLASLCSVICSFLHTEDDWYTFQIPSLSILFLPSPTLLT